MSTGKRAHVRASALCNRASSMRLNQSSREGARRGMFHRSIETLSTEKVLDKAEVRKRSRETRTKFNALDVRIVEGRPGVFRRFRPLLSLSLSPRSPAATSGPTTKTPKPTSAGRPPRAPQARRRQRPRHKRPPGPGLAPAPRGPRRRRRPRRAAEALVRFLPLRLLFRFRPRRREERPASSASAQGLRGRRRGRRAVAVGLHARVERGRKGVGEGGAAAGHQRFCCRGVAGAPREGGGAGRREHRANKRRGFGRGEIAAAAAEKGGVEIFFFFVLAGRRSGEQRQRREERHRQRRKERHRRRKRHRRRRRKRHRRRRREQRRLDRTRASTTSPRSCSSSRAARSRRSACCGGWPAASSATSPGRRSTRRSRRATCSR